MNYQRSTYQYKFKKALISSLLIVLLPSACKKIEPEHILKISTGTISEINYSSSVAEGVLVDIMDDGVSQHGHCWSTSENPTNSSPTRSEFGERTNKGSFQSHLDGLTPGTTYHIRAYGQKGDLVIYGENITFNTAPGELPVVVTYEAKEVTMSSAVCSGIVIDDGGYPVTVRGICWNTTGAPTPEDHPIELGPGLGDFEVEINGLNEQTQYYVKAFATNEQGTALGDEIVFITSDRPVVHTLEIGLVTPTSIACVGDVTDEGGSHVYSKGFCWGIEPEPTKSDTYQEFGEGLGEFTGTIPELTPATEYYIRAYAENINETAYGEEFRVVTSFTDERDGKTYAVTRIGEQYWMAQNLDFGELVDFSVGQKENDEVEKYCYDNDAANCEVYGGIYTWNEAMQYTEIESTQGVCPSGWHLPSDEEWKTLEMAIGMSREEADKTGTDEEDYLRGTDEGGKLKSEGTELWEDPNVGATNETGFSALPIGFSNYIDDRFEGIHLYTTFWTSTTGEADFTAYYRQLFYDWAKIGRRTGYVANGTPVRCVKDEYIIIIEL